MTNVTTFLEIPLVVQVRNTCAVNTNSGRELITYVTENLICLARADGVLLFRVAGPLVQVGAVDDVTQHVLAPLGHFIGDDVRRDVSLGFALMVALLVQSLYVEENGKN